MGSAQQNDSSGLQALFLSKYKRTQDSVKQAYDQQRPTTAGRRLDSYGAASQRSSSTNLPPRYVGLCSKPTAKTIDDLLRGPKPLASYSLHGSLGQPAIVHEDKDVHSRKPRPTQPGLKQWSLLDSSSDEGSANHSESEPDATVRPAGCLESDQSDACSSEPDIRPPGLAHNSISADGALESPGVAHHFRSVDAAAASLKTKTAQGRPNLHPLPKYCTLLDKSKHSLSVGAEEAKLRADIRQSTRQNGAVSADTDSSSGVGPIVHIERVTQPQSDNDADSDSDVYPKLKNAPWKGEFEPLELGDGGRVPAAINQYLKAYQRAGVQWLWDKYTQREGGILADDMGLGKTVQIVAFLSAVLKKTGTSADKERLLSLRRSGKNVSAAGGPVLIVAPSSITPQWTQHLEVWGHFMHRPLGPRSEVQGELVDAEQGRLEVVVCSYNQLQASGSAIARVKWHMVVFDEYHRLKAPKSQTSLAAARLVRRTCVRYGLTGTPVQNNLKELWWLMELVQPGCLGDKAKFKEHFGDPIKFGQRRKAGRAALELAQHRRRELEVIRQRHMLKRTKESELSGELLGKSDMVVFCDMAPVQKDLYASVLALPEYQLLTRGRERCDCGRDEIRARCCYMIPATDMLGETDRRAVLWRKQHPDQEQCANCPWCIMLPAIAKLQKIANHPCLLQVDARAPEHQREEARRFAEVAFTDNVQTAMGGLQRSQQFVEVCRTDVCGKMQTLALLLERFEKERGSKVLLFSWSVQMLDVLQAFVRSKGYSHVRLDGSTPQGERQGLIQRFNSEPSMFLFLVSTKAGGLGLNLTGANRVIIYDVNWNPSHDAQAQDRAYRIGQQRYVRTFRLISTGSIEEMTYMRQIYKLQLSGAALGDKHGGGRRQFTAVQDVKGEEGELFGIFNLLRFKDTSMLAELREQYRASRPDTVSEDAPEDKPYLEESEEQVMEALGFGVRHAAEKVRRKLKRTRGAAGSRALGKVDSDSDTDDPPAEDEDEDEEGEWAQGFLEALGSKAYRHEDMVARDQDDEEADGSETSDREGTEGQPPAKVNAGQLELVPITRRPATAVSATTSGGGGSAGGGRRRPLSEASVMIPRHRAPITHQSPLAVERATSSEVVHFMDSQEPSLRPDVGLEDSQGLADTVILPSNGSAASAPAATAGPAMVTQVPGDMISPARGSRAGAKAKRSLPAPGKMPAKRSKSAQAPAAKPPLTLYIPKYL